MAIMMRALVIFVLILAAMQAELAVAKAATARIMGDRSISSNTVQTNNMPNPAQFPQSVQSIQSIQSAGSFESPSSGTLVTAANQQSLVSCANQTICLKPHLQLAKRFKVYLCKRLQHYGVNVHYVVAEGLNLHPKVDMVQDMAEADFVIYMPVFSPWNKSECNQTYLSNKLIVLDDYSSPKALYSPPGAKDWYLLYFKRSYVDKKGGLFVGFPHLLAANVLPLTFSLQELDLHPNFQMNRAVDVYSPIKPSKRVPAKKRVLDWLQEFGKQRKEHLKVTTFNVLSMTIGAHPARYARIVVTVNHDQWEGGIQFWDALAAGALVFVDKLFTPMPFPFVDGQHVVFYDHHNQSDLYSKLDYYLNHTEEAQRVAYDGYLHAMIHHRSVNLVDFVLRSAHLKAATSNKYSKSEIKAIEGYVHTAQDLLAETRIQEPMIMKCGLPGMYELGKTNKQIRRVNC